MNCAFDKEKLTGYYDGELQAAEKAEVERHIASCSECLRELGELKSAAILVKDLPRLRAPRSIAEGVSREIQAAGKVHSFAKVRRMVLWASAAAAALFVGLNVMYFSTREKSAAPAPAAATAPPVAKIQQRQEETLKAPGEKEAASRRAAGDRALADEQKLREVRKAVEEQKDLRARDDAEKKFEAPVERSREKDKADVLAGKGAAEAKPAGAAAEPPAAQKSPAAPATAAPAPVAKPAAPAPVPEAAEKAAPKKESENLARSEPKRSTGLDPAAEGPPTHFTFASTQISKARTQVDDALRKIGVAPPPPPPPVKSMKAAMPRETETAIPLELTDSQIARLRQELNKPGASVLLAAAPGDPVLAEFRDGRMFGKKEGGAGVTGGAAAPGTKSKESAKNDGKADPPKDAKESKEADFAARGFAEAPADKSGEPRRKIILHLIEVPYVPDVQPAGDSIKK
jgi:hypothetical protein